MTPHETYAAPTQELSPGETSEFLDACALLEALGAAAPSRRRYFGDDERVEQWGRVVLHADTQSGPTVTVHETADEAAAVWRWCVEYNEQQVTP